MAILTNPPAHTVAYRPVMWQASYITSEPQLINAVVVVWENEVQIATFRVNPYYKSGPVAGLYVYNFNIDIQTIIQKQLLPSLDGQSGTFLGIGATDVIDSPNYYAIYTVSVTYEAISVTTGLLFSIVDVDLPDVGANTETAAISLPPAFNNGLMNRFLPIFQPDNGNDYLAKQFTNCKQTFITKKDNASLSAYIGVISGPHPNIIYVTCSNGATGFFYFETASPYITYPAGPANFELISWSSGPNPFTDSVDWYDIRPASFDGDHTFIETHQPVRFNVKRTAIDREIRLHFLNSYGASDSITIQGKIERLHNVTSGIAEKQLYWIPGEAAQSVTDRGNYNIDIRSVLGNKITVEYLDRDIGEWLTELQKSIEVYVELTEPITGERYYQPCTVKAKESIYYNPKWAIKFEIDVYYANEQIAHRF